jgi:hypothetical protein
MARKRVNVRASSFGEKLYTDNINAKHVEYYLSFHSVLVLSSVVMTVTLNVKACKTMSDRQYDIRQFTSGCHFFLS